MKRKKKKILVPFLIVLLGSVLCIGLGMAVQAVISREVFEESSGYFIEKMEKALDEREIVLKQTFDNNDMVNAQLLYNMSYVFEGEEILKKDGKVYDSYEKQLEELNRKAGLDQLFIVDPEGNILLCSSVELKDRKLQEVLGIENTVWEKIRNAEFLDEEDEYQYGYGITVADGSDKAVYSYPVFTEESDCACAYFVGVSDEKFMQDIISDSRDLSMFFEPLVAYDGIIGFAADTDTGTVLYSSQDLKDMTGKSLAELEIADPRAEADGMRFTARINGTDRNVIVRHFSYKGLGNWAVFCCDTRWSVVKINSVTWLVLLFLVVGLLYMFTMNSYRGIGKAKMLRSVLVSTVTALIIVAAGVRYIYSMSATSLAMEQINVNDDAFIRGFQSNQKLSDSVKEYYESRSLMTLDTLATYIENYEDEVLQKTTQKEEYYTQRTEDGKRERIRDAFGNDLYGGRGNFSLDMLAGNIGAKSLQILNGDGRTIASSDENWYYELSDGTLGCEEQLTEVLDHKRSGFYFIRENSDEENVEEIFALPIRIFMKRGEDGKTEILNAKEYEKELKNGTKDVIADDGLILATGRKPRSVYHSTSSIVLRTLESITAAQATRIAVVIPAEDTISGSTQDLSAGDVRSLGYFETYDGRESYRFSKLNGVRVFSGIVACTEPYALITVFDRDDMMEGAFIIGLVYTGFMLLILLSVSIWFIRHEPVQPEETDEKILVVPQTQMQYSGIRDYLSRLRSQEKTALFVKCCFLAAFLIMILRLLILRKTGSADLAFRYSMSENWQKGVHLFSLTFAFYVSLGVLTVMYLAQTMVKYTVPMLGAGTETVARLILSVLEYLGVLMLILFNLYKFGVQMGTMVTSAGIMSLVLGLGANSLISDVLAGLFIIIEQEYKVGDIVTIDNFTGFVRSIGLRTTKVQDFSGNIKTINNAKVSGVLNLTDNYTTFFVTMNIDINVPVEDMEQLVNVVLRERMKDNPELVAGPWFSGIPEVRGNAYSISIGASCLQQHAWSLRKKIIQEMLKLLKEKEIRMV